MSSPLSVWILQTGEPLHCDSVDVRPMRAMNLANALVDQGHYVTLWSSAFYHQEKRHRSRQFQKIIVSQHLEICLVPSPGYQRNVSLARLWDHLILAWNLRSQLRREKELPDIAFIGYPPIETAAVMVRWLDQHCVPTMMDIKDQWPTLLVDSVPARFKPISAAVLGPYFLTARTAMHRATGLSAMSGQFLDWALSFSRRNQSQWDRVIPLTSPAYSVNEYELDEARLWWNQRGVSADNTLRIIFVGSFSRAFDFEPIFQAAESLGMEGVPCQFVLCGDGEQVSVLKREAENLDNLEVVEWIDRPKIVALSERSAAALAPYRNSSDFNASIPNKVIDALLLGLPILSPLQGEVMKLIRKDQVGLEYGEAAGNSLQQCISMFMEQPGLLQQLSENAKSLYKTQFSYEKVYGGLVKHLEEMAHGDNR